MATSNPEPENPPARDQNDDSTPARGSWTYEAHHGLVADGTGRPGRAPVHHPEAISGWHTINVARHE